MTDSSFKLVKQLNSNDSKLIVTTIQKMSNAIKNERHSRKLKQFHNKHVVFIEDECHRTQFGEMRIAVNKWFENAQHFGFTGTPIFEENMGQNKRTTENLYDECLHKYLIKDAIRDKNVLPFNEHAFMDRTKDKVGYEIPFTRIFYKFVEPRKSDEIFAEFKELSNQEQELMKKILGE